MTPQKPVRTGKTVPAPPPQRVCVGDERLRLTTPRLWMCRGTPPPFFTQTSSTTTSSTAPLSLPPRLGTGWLICRRAASVLNA